MSDGINIVKEEAMASEKTFSVTVYPDETKGEYLTVDDALCQVLDLIDALERTESPSGPRQIVWRLTEARTNSPPFTVVATPFPAKPDISIVLEAARTTNALTTDMRGLLMEGRVEGAAIIAAEPLEQVMRRNIGRIARTEIIVDGLPPISIGRQNAAIAQKALEDRKRNLATPVEDWTRTELGAVEGEIVGIKRYYGKPALQLIERISGAEVTVTLSDDLWKQVSPLHSWSEVWQGHRFQLTGLLYYGADGALKRAEIEEIGDFEEIEAADVPIERLRRADVLGDRTMEEHLADIRRDAFGG